MTEFVGNFWREESYFLFSSILRFTWWRMVLVLLAPLRSPSQSTAICEDFNPNHYFTRGKILPMHRVTNAALYHQRSSQLERKNSNFISCEIEISYFVKSEVQKLKTWMSRHLVLCLTSSFPRPPLPYFIVSIFPSVLYFRFVALPKNEGSLSVFSGEKF